MSTVEEDDNNNNNEQTDSIPILLLKTKSTPTDVYADHFSSLRITLPAVNNSNEGRRETITFEPLNLPVLENTFNETNILELERLLLNGAFDDDDNIPDDDDEGNNDKNTSDDDVGRRRDHHYGGIIFTSQRAVEAFVDVAQRVVMMIAGM